nr:LOW QUALITY PROTEIN: urocanate hydratase [Ciona intestinalis]|eukprot:XP_026694668.1 LOW QUALITY PROTEIN: urocanate hydratase [Ciona intestinalis]
MMAELKVLCNGIPDQLPELKPRDTSIPHAPFRNNNLSEEERKTAIKNALRYFAPKHHKLLATEFAEELRNYGHIYMYRLLPQFQLKAYHIDAYPCVCKHAAAIMLMIMNNLDHVVAQYPHELVTYGGNGQVFSNWAQFWLTMGYLSRLTTNQTLVMCSGHPQGLFPSNSSAPRVVITNGMVIPNYSTSADYDRMFAMGVTMYGQMTAGSYCYIGPQGIVHGTTITVMNAGRKYLNVENLRGKVFLTSGLGGMSGAQAKAATIAGCVGIIAEIDETALNKRYNQGWLMKKTSDLDDLIRMLRDARGGGEVVSIGYHGNIVDLWERLVEIYEETGECLHDVYYRLRRQVTAINKLTTGGLHFWDYGNAFLFEAKQAGGDVLVEGEVSTSTTTKFKYPSYVQHIMGDIFSLGFGPFRWVCTSGCKHDLQQTDQIAADVIQSLMKENISPPVMQQYSDNLKWIQAAHDHQLVVGSQARILYSDQQGRIKIAQAFNQAVSEGKISAPVVISRDHHDVSGTDSPYRETSNIYDESAFCADMAVQNCIGDSFRGATWVALHNGSGVGWGEVVNGGFGVVLDGSEDAGLKAGSMLAWDVSNGVTRRAWAGNVNAMDTIKVAMTIDPNLEVTLPSHVTDDVLNGQI